MVTTNTNSSKLSTNIYKIRDVAVRFNRNKRAIIRWEQSGKIPPAKRNASDERVYNEADILRIANLLKQEHFYRRRPKR